MSEAHEPPLRLTIQGLRWMGRDFRPMRDAVPYEITGTDYGDDAEILRLLRKRAAKQMDMQFYALAAKREALDFDSPNAPTETDLDQMVRTAEFLMSAIRVLRELAPEIEDDDEDDDAEAVPDPEGTAHA